MILDHPVDCGCTACAHAVLAYQPFFDRPEQLDRAADELADGEVAQRRRAVVAEQQLRTLADFVLRDDQVGALAFVMELGFGTEVEADLDQRGVP